ncbi:zinc-binding alcohol dehydrogenase family protein [Pelagicoccus sp. SDUM812002]|uniref:zinc-binding alcohol dehydrogenase family protein n=1 Tax=Pelagicoccus sp. SDUM812002 TaxID=3041266 RepID=UPI00280CF3E2|nr:zinc-binding alcohol dehydrogenase family protein [Pelagicoccus sp. SDUM812002]MDQ8184020.1 zinc-binding alcohol dehydrogenase family protein [Pelagicoccus sp. SDUM812002]
MKAIQFQPGLSLENTDVAREVDLPKPEPTGRDILVEIEAIGLNPVDTKVRPGEGTEPKVLGFDAAGTVVAAGDATEMLKVGDKVYYAGSVARPGTNSQFHLVDERIAAVRPSSLDSASAAAIPLTALTAWESLFDRLGIDPDGGNVGKSLLIIGGAGGVGSIGIQLAKLAGLTVIATASREESKQWCLDLGADFVVNHGEELPPQMENIGFKTVDFIANFNNTDAYWDAMGQLIAPQGGVVLIVEPSGSLDIGGPFKLKSARICWELMFTRAVFETTDIEEQHRILERVASLIDEGKLRSTAKTKLSPINVGNVLAAHGQLESGRSIGKIVIVGWSE